MSESFLYNLIKFFGFIFCRLPRALNMFIARLIGLLGYYLMSKKRAVVKFNLKVAFPNRSLSEIRVISKQVFQNFACSFMDLLSLPKIKAQGFDKTVKLEGRENLAQALSSGKGCILLAIHSGSWELASLVGSMCNYPYNIVANEQQKAPRLNELLNEYRRMSGAKVIPPGVATREIIRALQNNELVSLVLDQGGKDGTAVDFFGKTASMSTGAIRLGLKYQTPICPVWIERQTDGSHILKVFPALSLVSTNREDQDVYENTQRLTKFFEVLLEKNPYEFMWFYKVYKYSTQANVLILDDGKTGHLRQSQALAESLKTALRKKGKEALVKTVTFEFKNEFLQKIFSIYCALAQYLSVLKRDEVLQVFLKPESFSLLVKFQADYIISCGSQGAGINFTLSKLKTVKSFHILKPGLLSEKRFNLVLIPEHDHSIVKSTSNIVFTKAALNLITPVYLKQQEENLLSKYSHLKTSVRTKIGILLGGNTKGVNFDLNQIRFLIKKLKEAAQHYNIDLMLTTSRRTPKAIDELINKELRRFERCTLLIIANETNIPEAVGGILGLSDIIIVSGESISMVSEAVSSGKKTIVFSPTGEYAQNPGSKYDRFVLNLSNQGYLLATSIKDITTALNQAMSQKISTKNIDDHQKILKAIESVT